MAFSANPLSLSVPQPALESWLRDCGYLELLDDRHAHSSSLDERTGFVTTIFSFISVYPFARLTADDFAGKTPSWTSQFFDSGEGFFNSYSFPSGASQVRMRIQENVKRYARNYACLSLLVLACCLYQMPIALLGVILTLALWDLFKICSSKWRLERYPLVHYIILFLVRCGTAIVLYWSNVPSALICAIIISYGVMILHSSLRKLTPSKQPAKAGKHKGS